MVKKIKNLIFDLDNTLYDFSTVWKKSNKLVFEYLGYDKITSYDEFFTAYKRINNELMKEIHRGNLKLINLRNERLIKTMEIYGLHLTLEDCGIYYKKQFDFIIDCIEPNEELNEKLKKLSKKYKLILLTNGKSYEQRLKLKKLGLDELFSLYISEETKVSKPKPQALTNILDNENLIVDETMMVGDSIFYDIKPAQKLGLKTCLIEKKWHFDDKIVHYEGCKVKNINDFLEQLEML